MSEKQDYIPVSTGPGLPVHSAERGQPWRQYIIAGSANLSVVMTGYTMGWTAPVFMKLQDVGQSPFPEPISKIEEAWIGSLLTIGAVFGPFIGGPLAASIGRKWSLLSSSLPLLLGFILVAVAKTVVYLYAARILWGLAIGMIFTICPMYCVEIATVPDRGALGSLLQFFNTMGFLTIYSIGPYVSYYPIAYIGIAIIMTYAVLFLLPESPKYCLMTGNRDGAAASLMTLRGKSRAGVEDELYALTQEINASMEKTGKLADVFKGTNFKAFYISCTLLSFQQFCGICAVLFYMTRIFAAAGSNLDPAIATIIIGIIQIIAAAFASLVIDRLGRKLLLLISSVGTSFSLGLLGLYFYLVYVGNPIAQSLGLVPLVSMILYIITYESGLGPISWLIMSELLPIELKAVASPIVTGYVWILSFLITRYFGPIEAAMGMQVVFWGFSASCALCFFFCLLVVPEIKGKTVSEIEAMLAGGKETKQVQEKVPMTGVK